MTTKPKLTTQDKALLLISAVRAEGDGLYSVASENLSGWRWLVQPRTTTTLAKCDCQDYRYKAPRTTGQYRCKHLLAVRYFLTQPKF